MRVNLTAIVATVALVISTAAATAWAQTARRQSYQRTPHPSRDIDTPTPITYRQLRRLVFMTLGLLLFFGLLQWFVSRTSEVLMLLVISLILAVALRPTVDRMSRDPIPFLKRPIRRALAVVVLYLAIATVLVTLILMVVPQLATEAERLISNSPRYLQNLDQMVAELRTAVPFLPAAATDISGLASGLLEQFLNNIPQAFNVLLVALNTLSGLFSIGVILIITLFLIVEADPLYNHVTSLIPPSHRGQARQMTSKMGTKIEGWLKGVVILSLSIGIPTGLFMWAIGMPFPLLLGVLAGLFELVPLVGAYLGAAPAVVLALFQPTWMLIAVIAFFIVLQMAENNILAPAIMGSQVDIPPLLVIIALLIGASLMGILGAILAVPVAAVLQVIWTDLVVPGIKSQYTDKSRARKGV